ncbi:MAG: tRNA pseudouridine(55) synthase, partial [Pygmaiobacter sp.]
PLFVGTAVKAVDLPQNHEKTYLATLKFGVRTPTADLESEVCEVREAHVTAEALSAALKLFLGESEQLPPMFSAVKVNGQPLYKAARKGREVERTPRSIAIRLCEQVGDNEYTIEVTCSKGTYIRVLVEDIAARLDTIATMTALRRTKSGDFALESSHTMEEILALANMAEDAHDAEQLLLPVDSIFVCYPRLDASEELKMRLLNGAPTHIKFADGVYRVYFEGAFLGIATVQERRISVKKLFVERT